MFAKSLLNEEKTKQTKEQISGSWQPYCLVYVKTIVITLMGQFGTQPAKEISSNRVGNRETVTIGKGGASATPGWLDLSS